MIKVIIYVNKYGKTNARLVLDLVYRQVVLSWDTYLCAEVLRISVAELLEKEIGTYLVK